jgi:transcriptional regulator
MAKIELLQGTLDLLILRVLKGGPQHGFGIAQRIHLLSQESLRVEEGALYPALHRIERKGWIEAEWRPSENNRRAKYYQLTGSGRKHLAAEREGWNRLTTVMAQILDAPQ